MSALYFSLKYGLKSELYGFLAGFLEEMRIRGGLYLRHAGKRAG